LAQSVKPGNSDFGIFLDSSQATASRLSGTKLIVILLGYQ
jgi:hypothetical protein